LGQESNVNNETDQIEERKTEHIRVCLEEDVGAKNITTGFEDVHLIHRALPEINRDDINLSTEVFGHKFSAPVIVTGITGGTKQASKINAAIAQAVEELGLGMGVGSQRAALQNPELECTYSVVRKMAPTAFLVANIGAPQIVREYSLEQVRRAVDMIEADALAIHLNPLQEAVQPEGETGYAGILRRISELTDGLDVPVIVKETGAGISAEDAKRLEAAGVAGIDVAGAGGTSWAAVEYFRAKQRSNGFGQELGKHLWDWGIPTVVTGAKLGGLALPLLSPALQSSGEVKKALSSLIRELKTVMFLVGARSTERLNSVPVVVTGKTAEWLRSRGFSLDRYAQRGG